MLCIERADCFWDSALFYVVAKLYKEIGNAKLNTFANCKTLHAGNNVCRSCKERENYTYNFMLGEAIRVVIELYA